MTGTFLHLSDLHLTRPGQLVSGIDSLRNVREVMAYIGEHDIAPSFVVVSGDLSNDGSPESYAVLAGILAELPSELPILLALGNHDDRTAFGRVILGQEGGDGLTRYHYSQTVDGLRVIVLDSLVPGQDAGALGPEQIAWLDRELQESAPAETLIVLHHCCRLAAPAHHFPAFILRDAPALEEIVARHHERILGVLAGHSHQANAALFGGTLHATAPAILCQLDFFAGETYAPVAGAGFNLCQIQDGQLVVSPVVTSRESWVVGRES